MAAMISALKSAFPLAEVLHLSALAYLCFWHFGIQLYFIRSTWWHFLDPANLSMDLGAVAGLFLVCAVLPLLMEIPPVLRLLTRFWWAFVGLVPALLLPFTAVPSPKFRTAILSICCACGYAGNATAFSAGAGSPLSRSWSWAISLGVLLMEVVKMWWGSVNPFMDRHYNDPQDSGVVLKLVGCVVAAAAAWYARGSAVQEVAGQDVEGGATPAESVTSEGSGARCCGDRQSWLWLAVAPVMACALTLNGALMSHPAAMAKFAGAEPFPTSLIMPALLVIGLPCGYALARRGAALPLSVACALLLGVGLLAGDTECRGPDECGGFSSLVGAVFVAVVQPALFLVVFIEASRLCRADSRDESRSRCCGGCGFVGAVGRLFASSGFLIFIHVYLYICANMYNLPFIGGRVGAWLWVVTLPAVLGLVVIASLSFKDQGLAQAFNPTREVQALDVPLDGKPGPTPKAAIAIAAFIAVALLIPAAGYRASRLPGALEPSSGAALTVMAFNNQQGYDTSGYWNGECFVDLVRLGKADHVAIPEGDAMRAYIGNRDAVLYAAATLEMHAYYGPPAWTGGAGVSVLSTREFLESSWQAMPKDPANMNRFVISSIYSVGGVRVTVLSVHAEWFGDPSAQTTFLAQMATVIEGPVVLTGDFNLEPNGASNNAVNASGLQVLVDAGLESATPLLCTGDKPKGHQCRSSFPNTVVDVDCRGLEDCDGYQLDYIFYTPRWLRVAPGSVRVLDGEVRKGTYCSDHFPLLATLELTNEAKTTPGLRAN